MGLRVDSVVLSQNEFKEILEGWDWPFFFHSVKCLGSQFNEPSWRMMKGEVICAALEISSYGHAKYVDEVGYDMLVGDTKVEVKTEMGIIHSNLKRTKKIQLKNTRPRLGVTPVLEKTFDYLLIVNTSSPYVSAFATWETVEKNQKPTSDQIQCQLMSEDLVFITPHYGVNLSEEVSSRWSMKEYAKEGINEWLSDIKGQVEDLPNDGVNPKVTDY